MTRILPFALSAALAALAVVLYLDNRGLRRDLDAARAVAQRQAGEAAGASPTIAAGDDDTPDGPARPGRRRGGGGGPGAVLNAFGRMMAGASDHPPPGDGPPPDPATRRERQQKRIRDLLGRLPGETDEQYHARVAPLVGVALARPRARVEEQRREFEAAADLTDEQRQNLEGALADARSELVGLASKSVAAGDLTPYRRNTAGLLNFVGGVAGVTDGFDARLRQILGPEQLSLLDQTGFDVIEYLGLTTPWETVTPPPPPNL